MSAPAPEAPGIYSERAFGGSYLVTIVGRTGEPLAYMMLSEQLTQGELPPEIQALYDRVVGNPGLRLA